MSKLKLTSTRISPTYLLSALTIFLSAFLLFQIQPMIGKTLLPWFGGTTAVWATSLMFFTTSLFVGYLYVFCISKLAIKWQAILHLGLLSISTIFIVYVLLSRGSLVDNLDWTIDSNISPTLIVLAILLFSIGLPYIVLSATSPLVQHWFSIKESKEPYHLYAISNIGSFIALFSYPLLFERISTLQNQQKYWAISFLIFAFLCILISISALIHSHDIGITERINQKTSEKMPWIRWTLYSAFTAFMLVATTTVITKNIAPIPLLWIIPLSIYLSTYIIAYSGMGDNQFMVGGLAVFTIAAISQTLSFYSLLGILFIYSGFLFMVGIVFHVKAYRIRPDHDRSSVFYLFGAIGGALGTISASIIPPIIFNDIWEFKIGLFFIVIFLLYDFYKLKIKELKAKFQKNTYKIGSIVTCLIVAMMLFVHQGGSVIYQNRTFFGHNVVTRTSKYTSLYNNGSTHGVQYNDDSKGIVPTTYYAESTGIGMAFDFARGHAKDGKISAGIIGLGSGTLASYCKPGDTFNFYEIDRDVEYIANRFFTFLEKCKNHSIEIGDGRILLDQKISNGDMSKFDLLAVDAFSGASVPTHLLTAEAMQIFKDHLASPKSIIAFHVTNIYLDLKLVVAAATEEVGLSYKFVPSRKDSKGKIELADWILIAQNESIFKDKAFKGSSGSKPVRKISAWTDEKTDILSVLKL